MLIDDIVDMFADLHRGSLDAYGTEFGSCERSEHPSYEDYRERIENHLLGVTPLGVYPMSQNVQSGDWEVSWGCVDFDEGEQDSHVHALNLQAVLLELDITSWVCRSRSKGFHVWVYASEWVDAALMRRALTAATQIAQAPTKEINPKQERLSAGQLGNYVRLEYPGHLDAEPNMERRVALVGGEPLPLEEFTLAAFAARTTAEDLKKLRPLYRAPQATERRPRKPRTWSVGASHNDTWSMSPLARHILNNGPYTENGNIDRSAALWKLANLLREDGLGPSETLQLVTQADQRWGKHHERGTLEYLTKMVDKVFDA